MMEMIEMMMMMVMMMMTMTMAMAMPMMMVVVMMMMVMVMPMTTMMVVMMMISWFGTSSVTLLIRGLQAKPNPSKPLKACRVWGLGFTSQDHDHNPGSSRLHRVGLEAGSSAAGPFARLRAAVTVTVILLTLFQPLPLLIVAVQEHDIGYLLFC